MVQIYHPFIRCVIFLFLVTTANLISGQQTPESKSGFELPGVDGETVRLAAVPDQPVVLFFLGTECPLAKLYTQRVNLFTKEYDSKIRFIGINSNTHDSLDDLKKFTKTHNVLFQIGKDYQNRIADQFGVTRTPEAILISQKGTIVYRGRIDDQYSPGISRQRPTSNYLKDAIAELLAGKAVSLEETKAVGCLIGRVKQPSNDSKVTYCNQISRILQKHCVECHRSGEIGPFELTDYEEIVGWADMMLEVINENRMPPWHANPKHGEFKNARSMTAREKLDFKTWVDAGAPYGIQSRLPEQKKFTSGWSLPKKPDREITMRKKPFNVPADGTVDYQYFVVDPKFKEDKWVTAAQVLPGNPAVVHHSIVFIRPPDGNQFRGIGWLAAYVPGQRANSLPEKTARRIPAGSKLVFQQHYTPNGSPQTDVTKIGLVFTDKSNVQNEVYTIAGIDQEFVIPPNKANHSVSATVKNLPRKGKLLGVAPHMHLRGKSFRAIQKNDGIEKIICDVPAYDFNWQHAYEFSTPIDLAKIASLEFHAVFDNSPGNPVNPNPNETVTWGDQTNEEMAVAFFDLSVPLIDAPSVNRINSNPKTPPTNPSTRIVEFVDQYFERFDRNGDGVITKKETPIATRSFGFWKFDQDRNGKLTRDEITKAAAIRIR